MPTTTTTTLALVLSAALLGCGPRASAQLRPPPRIYVPGQDSLSTFTGIVQTLYPDGKPHVWKELLNGEASGTWLEWYPSGAIRYRAAWWQGKGHGTWEYFYPTGLRESAEVYEQDLLVGLASRYHPNGQLATEGSYLRGQRHGYVRTFAPDGTPLAALLYQDDKRVLNVPVLFEPGRIATEANQEWDITFEPDGNTLYFTRKRAGTTAQQIYRAERTPTGWSEPRPAAFSTGPDEGAFITPDGQRFYFASLRPLPGRARRPGSTDMNLWVMDKKAGRWSTPRPLSAPINFVQQPGEVWPTHYEAGPTTDAVGNLYYWSGSRTGSDANLYQAPRQPDGRFGPPQELPTPPNSRGADSGPCLSPDGNLLFFASYDRADGLGQEDIYYCRKVNGQWSSARNLGPAINSGRNDICPRFSPDGKHFFFSSDRAPELDPTGERVYSIYYLETAYLLLQP
ncbi:PD40 domain-containing protein [Hymenobacter lapidiphilus]|uniref:PD40 domain-containing protein n=1 Tax=Hymenobacter lapidiphilus TaxID=2608003 RepID=A0A7Y7PPL2_9BACT|nr:PD40 domain-containing protein [Hymenobacter lapidiphilus]NVO31653.1 PD40 domain-containing protein [Hymenobacter lapidiphilus]